MKAAAVAAMKAMKQMARALRSHARKAERHHAAVLAMKKMKAKKPKAKEPKAMKAKKPKDQVAAAPVHQDRQVTFFQVAQGSDSFARSRFCPRSVMDEDTLIFVASRL